MTPKGEVRGWPNSFSAQDLADVYVVRCEETGLVKIGRTMSDRFDWRLRELTAATRSACEMLAVFEGTNALEAELHALFAPHRRHGEWFELTEDHVAFLQALPSRVQPYRMERYAGKHRRRRHETRA